MDFHDKVCVPNWTSLFSPDDVAERLEQDHFCYIAEYNSEIIGFLWFAINYVYSPDLRSTFIFNNKSAVSYNGFVSPHYRGKNVLPLLHRAAFAELCSSGFTKAFGYSLSTNIAVEKSLRKLHAQKIGRIIYGYLFGYYYFLSNIRHGAGLIVKSEQDAWYRWRSLTKRLYTPNYIYKGRQD